MKLLIIGKTGQLGSQIIIDAQKLGYDVHAMHRKFDITKNGYMNINYLDITDFHLDINFLRILNEVKPDVVINTASYHDLKLCELNPSSAFTHNCVAVKNMAEICNKQNIKFVTFSTNYVFDGLFNFNTEYEETNPIQMYGLSKLVGEKAALWYDTTTVIRTSLLYGINGRNNFIDARINDSKKHDIIEVDCKQLISSTYVNDLSKAILELIKKDCLGIYHLINENYHSYYQLTKEIYNIMDIKNPVFPIDQKCYYNGVKRPELTVLENIEAKKIGITLPNWKDALKRYLTEKYGV